MKRSRGKFVVQKDLNLRNKISKSKSQSQSNYFKNRDTALLLAIRVGNFDHARSLIENSAKVNFSEQVWNGGNFRLCI